MKTRGYSKRQRKDMRPNIIKKSKSKNRSKKTTERVVVPTIETIPNELISEILGRVAASSVTDMFSAKLSSKRLNEIAEDQYVYQRVSLNKFPAVLWKRLSEQENAFLNKCRECEHPELMYRQAVEDYFKEANLQSTCINLYKALKSSHMGALYAACIVFLFDGDDDLRRNAIEVMGDLRKSKSCRKKLKLCRNNLLSILRKTWVTNPILKRRPICCTARHQWKPRWDEDADIQCEACAADREIGLICETYIGD